VARWVPGDETSAVSELSFIGCEAHVTAAATIDANHSASQASVLDVHGRKHFILVMPNADSNAATPLLDGSRVIITAKLGAVYSVRLIAAPP
jgi:hypothetical protein